MKKIKGSGKNKEQKEAIERSKIMLGGKKTGKKQKEREQK